MTKLEREAYMSINYVASMHERQHSESPKEILSACASMFPLMPIKNIPE